jgi:hypothetical protein
VLRVKVRPLSAVLINTNAVVNSQLGVAMGQFSSGENHKVTAKIECLRNRDKRQFDKPTASNVNRCLNAPQSRISNV